MQVDTFVLAGILPDEVLKIHIHSGSLVALFAFPATEHFFLLRSEQQLSLKRRT